MGETQRQFQERGVSTVLTETCPKETLPQTAVVNRFSLCFHALMNSMLPQQALLSAGLRVLSTGLFMVLPTLNFARLLGHRILSILPIVNASGQN